MAELITVFAVFLTGWIVVGLVQRLKKSMFGSRSEASRQNRIENPVQSESDSDALPAPAKIVEVPEKIDTFPPANSETEIVKKTVVAARFDPELKVFRENEKLVDAILLKDGNTDISYENLKIRFTAGDLAGEEIELPAGTLTFGRNPAQAQIVIVHPEISGNHARIVCPVQSEAFFVVEDLGSTNGTRFRNSRIGIDDWRSITGKETFSAADVPGMQISLADGAFTFEIEKNTAS